MIVILASLSVFLYVKQSSESLKTTFLLAGNNRAELQKVLDHYRNDKQKLKAARFLIENMPGSFSADPEIEKTCGPFYIQYDSLSVVYNAEMSSRRGASVDSLWKNFSKQVPASGMLSDCSYIEAGQLIREIDLAFKAWQENVYTRNCSFDDFLEYILPYRRKNMLLISDERSRFYEKHHADFYHDPQKSFITETDSFLFRYKNIRHSVFFGTGIPIYSCNVLEQLQRGLCEQRCWFNSTLLSSLGMAVAIDFVPAWGNRNNSHSWNVVVMDGKSYAFEPFWDENRWKYKRMYNNKAFDGVWGKFRLPKVYRDTYANYFEGPMTDSRVRPEDIPVLFRNFKKKDVSAEYFETKDVQITLPQAVPENTYYCYLSVFGYQQWHPVQWGEIEKNKVTFNAMGKDIVYLPVYYADGWIQQAASPFLLKEDGSVDVLEPSDEKQTIALRAIIGAPLPDSNREYMKSMCGTSFSRIDDKGSSVLCTLPDSLGLKHSVFETNASGACRFIRVQLPSDSIALGDLSFYSSAGKITGVKIITPLTPTYANETIGMLTDAYGASAFAGKTDSCIVDIDLGKEYVVTAIGVTPYIKSAFYETAYFELFYWHNGWKSLGKQKGVNSFLIFENVPRHTLLMLKNCGWKPGATSERPFLYENGEVLWH